MKTARVCDLAIQVRGVTFAKSDASNEPREGTVGVVRAGNIVDGELDTGDLVFVPASKVSEKQMLRRHDVLIAASSGSLDVVGKAARVREDQLVAFGAFCKVLRPSTKVDPGYFSHYFQTVEYRRHVSSVAAGANINNLKNSDLDDIEIPLPPIEEQRRIAAVLDAADALRANRRRALAKLDALTDSIFTELFPRRTGGASAPLEELADTVAGNTWKSNRFSSGPPGLPLIRIQNVGNPNSDTAYWPDDFDNKYLVQTGALLLTLSGSFRIARWHGPTALLNQRILRIDPRDGVDDRWLLASLTRQIQEISRMGRDAVISNVSIQDVRALRIPHADQQAQLRFSSFATQIEAAKTLETASLASTEALFTSLQHRVFRGEL